MGTQWTERSRSSGTGLDGEEPSVYSYPFSPALYSCISPTLDPVDILGPHLRFLCSHLTLPIHSHFHVFNVLHSSGLLTLKSPIGTECKILSYSWGWCLQCSFWMFSLVSEVGRRATAIFTLSSWKILAFYNFPLCFWRWRLVLRTSSGTLLPPSVLSSFPYSISFPFSLHCIIPTFTSLLLLRGGVWYSALELQLAYTVPWVRSPDQTASQPRTVMST